MDDEPDFIDLMRPLLALQEHFLLDWGVHVGYRDLPLDADDQIPPGEHVTVRVTIDVPTEIAQLMLDGRRMFAA